MNFYLGCAVWAYKGWLGDLFPPGTKSGEFLRLYSRRLSTVEGNTTFYALPDPATVARWANETPEGFRFCPKLGRDVSHEGPLAMRLGIAQTFVERMRGLGSRLGTIFLQLPPGYSAAQLADLEAFLAAWPPDIRLAVEARHLSWYASPGESQLMELLERYAVGRVLMDVRPLELGPLPGAEKDLDAARDRKPRVPLHPLRSAELSLIRYIGHPDLELNAPLLDEWAARVAEWLQQGTTVYWFMHCPDEARSPELCRMFHRRLAQLVEIPAMPWHPDEGAEPQQQALF
jgi:uncharacterized protein YecE (DUF72 family)